MIVDFENRKTQSRKQLKYEALEPSVVLFIASINLYLRNSSILFGIVD